MKILFVCTGNIDRSRTAEEIFNETEGVEVKSAGTSIFAPVQLSRELIDWADRIFVMELMHLKKVLELDPDAQKKVECLGIPDVYIYDDPKLKKLLRDKMKTFINL